MKKIVIALVFISGALTSCKKEKTPAPSIVGFWAGKYGNGTTTYPATPYLALFRSNGTVRIFANKTDTASASKAEGTYVVSGSTVTATYNYSASEQYSVSATVDSKFTFIEGSWGSGTNTTDGGKWFMNKQ